MAQIPTQTVSICVSDAESDLIRMVATHTGASKSAWAAAVINAKMSSGQGRADVLGKARAIEAEGSPRGFRSGRTSAVMRQSDHDALKEAAVSVNLSAHAFAQAAVILAAETDRDKVGAAELRAETTARRMERGGQSLAVAVAIEHRGADVAAVSELLRQLVTGTAKAILEGKGPVIAAGCSKLAAEVGQGPTVALRLAVPEFEVAASAWVLGIPSASYATALATRAIRAVGAL